MPGKGLVNVTKTSALQADTYLTSFLFHFCYINENEYFKIRNGQSIKVNTKDGFYCVNYMDDLAFILNVSNGTAKSVCYLGD